MNKEETPAERKKRFKSLSKEERHKLIRKKLKKQQLKEGSGVLGKEQTCYENKEVIDLIILTKCLKNINFN